ncbi:MAG: response regulator transcription factor [Oligoflexia bacterium]|nr:response regulator transcription factor [Oligoflexia bacterium]
MKQLLLIEDDPTLGLTLKERLENEQYSVKWASTAEEAKNQLCKDHWDLIIFDVGLPDGSGFDLAKTYRKQAPFLFVTALSDAEHRLRGFELGAEEYIPKPFHLKELLMRVKHVLENHAKKKILTAGDIQLDLDALILRTNDGKIHRPALKDFQLLSLLIEKSPKVVSRDEILDSIWSTDHMGNQRTVDNAIVRLRAYFPNSNPIRSIRGVGYQWTLEDELK